MNTYVNTSGRELPIYADSRFTTKVGTLYRGSACEYLLRQEDLVAVLYKISTGGALKIGFTDYTEGAQES